MNKLELKIKEIESLFYLIFVDLNSLNDDNFDQVLSGLDMNVKKIMSLKEELKKSNSIQSLMKYEQNLGSMAKQLKERFDDIIKEKKIEQAKVGLELANIQNKKKLVIYSR